MCLALTAGLTAALWIPYIACQATTSAAIPLSLRRAAAVGNGPTIWETRAAPKTGK